MPSNTRKLPTKRKINRKWLMVGVIFLIILIFLGYGIYQSDLTQKITTSSFDSRPDRKDSKTLEGIVRLISNGEGTRTSDPSEDLMRYAITDSGESIRVGNKNFQTSSGGPGPGFYVDTSKIELGDKVLVRYVQDERSAPSLNCKECSIEILEPNTTVVAENFTAEMSRKLYGFTKEEIILVLMGASALLVGVAITFFKRKYGRSKKRDT